MTLLLDVGNSRVKWATLQHGELAAYGSATHHEHIAATWGALAAPGRVLAASVAGEQVNTGLAAAARQLWSVDIEFLQTPRSGGGIQNGYAQPERLGADRWAAMVGAFASAAGPVCVVDCGSAVTFDAVDGAGTHLGGMIAPGLMLMRGALGRGTAQLPTVAQQAEITPLARETVAAIASGTLLGLAAMVDGLAGEIAGRMERPPALWLTGGDAPSILPYLRLPFRHAPDLVLQGLAVIAEACA